MNNFKSNTILAKAGITFRGKAVPVPEPEKEPEPEMWVVLDVVSNININLIWQYNNFFSKSAWLNSSSNYLDDAFITVVDHMNDDAIVTSDILSRDIDTSNSEMTDFLVSNGFRLYNLSVCRGMYGKVAAAYWYGDKLNTYLVNTASLDFGGKTFRQYSAGEVLDQYSEWFDLDKHVGKYQLYLIDPSLEYEVSDTNNTAYGVGGTLVKDKKPYAAAFLSIGWACKMTQSEFNGWKQWCNNVRIEQSREIKHGTYSIGGYTWIGDNALNIAYLYTHRVQVINGTLLR